MFGTVVDWREGIARDAAPFLARHGRPDIDPRAFADAWRKRYQPAMEECRTGRRPFTRLDVLHRENLENVLRDNGLDPARIGEAELDAMNRAWHRLDPWPEAVAGLTRLRAPLRAGAALERQRRAAAEHGQARRHSVGRHPRRRGGAAPTSRSRRPISAPPRSSASAPTSSASSPPTMATSAPHGNAASPPPSSSAAPSTARTRQPISPRRTLGTWSRRTSRIWRRSSAANRCVRDRTRGLEVGADSPRQRLDQADQPARRDDALQPQPRRGEQRCETRPRCARARRSAPSCSGR